MSNVDDAETLLDMISQFGESVTNAASSYGAKELYKLLRDALCLLKWQSYGAKELYEPLCDALAGAGKLHWAAAGLSMVAFVLKRVELVQSNSLQCLELLKAMRDLGKHVVDLYPHFSDHDENLQGAICLISEGAILCCDHRGHGRFHRFGFAKVNKVSFLSLQERINSQVAQLSLAVSKTMLYELKRRTTMPLSRLQPESPRDTVGLDGRVKDVLHKLGMNDAESLKTGIPAVVLHGMGGIGKTTLAMALSASSPFKNYTQARVEIGEKPTDDKIRDCQRNILERLSGQKKAIGDYCEGCQELRSFLQDCKFPILLLIDNIFNGEDLRKLLPESLVLPGGSRVIVTSRDSSVGAVLKEKGVDNLSYPVQELKQDEARKLLCMQVFNNPSPPPSHDALVTALLNVCSSLPLALRVVGGYLRTHNNPKLWDFAIESLKKCEPLTGRNEDKLTQSLMFSYKQLSQDHQKVFSDICWLPYRYKLDVLEAIYGGKLVALEELALVRKIVDEDGDMIVEVHDLLVALGRKEQPGTRIESDGILPDKLG